MSSKPIVIACVTFETAMVVEPIVSLGASEVFLFHYVRDPGERKGEVYQEFYEEVRRQLFDRFPGIIVHDCSSQPIWDFSLMVREISNIVSSLRKYNPDVRILINTSSGTREFCNAGLIVSSRSEGVDAFQVSTLEYSVPIEKVAELYYSDGKPLGLTKHCREPKILPKFDLFVTDEVLVRSLRVFIRYYEANEYSIAKSVIEELKKRNLWTKTDASGELCYYERKYKREWLQRGWIEKHPQVTKRYRPTERGRLVADTFYTN